MVKSSVPGLMLLFLSAVTSNAHTWVEQLTVIAPNGTFIGAPGYARGNVPRTAPGFNDGTMTHLLSSTGPMNMTAVSGDMCMDSQKKPVQSPGNPRLQAAAGDAIALRYQENGHVTLPDTQKGKPKNRGTVYVYGTSDPKDNERLETIHKVWNKDGTGGDKRGVLLSAQDFDDKQCYQINGGEISQNRQKAFPHEADKLMGADLWCQQDIKLPEKLPSDKPYTLYWVWDWPTARGVDPGLPQGKQEIYTTCMDVDAVNKPKQQENVKGGFVDGQPLNNAAVKARFIGTMGSTFDVPVDDGNGGTSTPPAEVSGPPTPSPISESDPGQTGDDAQPGDDDATLSDTASADSVQSTATETPTSSGQDQTGDDAMLMDTASADSVQPTATGTPASSGPATLTTLVTVFKTVQPSGCRG